MILLSAFVVSMLQEPMYLMIQVILDTIIGIAIFMGTIVKSMAT